MLSLYGVLDRSSSSTRERPATERSWKDIAAVAVVRGVSPPGSKPTNLRPSCLSLSLLPPPLLSVWQERHQ